MDWSPIIRQWRLEKISLSQKETHHMFEQSLRSKSFTTQFWAQFQLKRKLTIYLSRSYAQRVSQHAWAEFTLKEFQNTILSTSFQLKKGLTHSFEYKFLTQKGPHTFFWIQVFNSKRASHILLNTSFQFKKRASHILLGTSFQFKKPHTFSWVQ